MDKTKKVFRSRISVFFVVLLLVLIVNGVFISLNLSREILACIVAILFCFLSLIGIRYVISGNKLYLKLWFMPFGGANIVDIVSIKRTYNPLSSPAASFRRLSIRSKTGWMMVSPVREKEFVETLKAINPDIEVNIPPKKGKWWRIWDWDI